MSVGRSIPVKARTQGEGASALSALNALVTRLESLLVVIAAIGIFAMMVILVIDVLGRYFFNRPLSWSYDFISIYLMPLVVFLALSDAFRKNQHIAVDLIYNGLSPVAKRALRLLASALIAAVMIPIVWLSALQASDRYLNDVVIAGSILWPTWIPSLIAALGTALLVLRTVLDTVALVVALATRSPDIPGESPARHENAAESFQKDAI